ncbi:MAG: hypothetical protein GXP29_05610, partial [Planctomycetes bacterium]|nr:hypothetical protein [Planctomycetota bacterium]
ALRTIHDAIAFSEAIESHPTVISNLVAKACYGMTFTLIEDLMTGFNIDQVTDGIQPASRGQVEALLAKLLDESGTRSAAVASCYGDGASYLRFLELVDEQGISAATGMRAGFADRLLDPLRKPLYTLDVVHAVRLQAQIVTAIGLPNWPRADACIPSGEDRRSVLHSLTHPVTDSMFGSLLRSARSRVQSHFRFRANRRMAATALAILLFEHDHGRRPSTLVEMVPMYLPHIPLDPFSPDGVGIRYLAVDLIPSVLYSVGPDGEDDAGLGKFDLRRASDSTGYDIPFQLDGRERWREAKMKAASEEAVADDED